MENKNPIGPYVRQNVLPANMSVAEAARKLDMSRPALSNFLNGKVSLSVELAGKLGSVFKQNADDLLERQAAMQNELQAEKERSKQVQIKAAGYLDIGSVDIENWSKKPQNRTALPILVRKLVKETAINLIEFDFPGGDDGERRGWDGRTKAEGHSPWVPKGTACWELSCSTDLPAKPNRDFKARSNLSAVQKRETDFIFVTTQRWAGKDDWAATQNAKQEWRTVKVIDADILAQWLDESASTQIWLAERMGRSTSGVRSLDQCRLDWNESTEPNLVSGLFADKVTKNAKVLQEFFDAPPNNPLTVVADSEDEALAFLFCALAHDGENSEPTTSAVVVSTDDAIRRTGAAMHHGTIIATTADAERAASSFFRTNYVIVVRPRSSVENDPDISLDPIERETFEIALKEMGLEGDRIERLRLESALSATILRRRLAKSASLQTPKWADEDYAHVRKLIPILLAGAWNKRTDDDRAALTLLTDTPYDEIEEHLAELEQLPDAPVWSLGNYRGVVSRIDALFAARNAITENDIERFLDLALVVLSEDDPSLDLEPEQRGFAGIYGKTRKISGALREAVGEMLVLLSLYGNRLFGARISGIETRIEHLVTRLLRDDDGAWMRQRDDLRLLSEASPAAFLDAIEDDLRSADSQTFKMLRPVTSAVFDSPDRTSMLWALEALAWTPEYYRRVGRILAKLSEVPINDNWANKPESSLRSLVRHWYPQTCADIGMRRDMLEMLIREYPEIGWRTCMRQVDGNDGHATKNATFRWRGSDLNTDRQTTVGEAHQTQRKALEIIFGFTPYDAAKLSDLLKLVPRLEGEDDRQEIWQIAERWLEAGPSESEKAEVRESIRRSARMRSREDSDEDGSMRQAFAEFSEKLEPTDLIAKHRWLFAQHYVQESWDEITNERLDFEERSKRIEEKRENAVREIWHAQGYAGIEALLASGDAHDTVGRILAKILGEEERLPFASDLLDKSTEVSGANFWCLTGFLTGIEETERVAFLRSLLKTIDEEGKRLLILQAAPCMPATWHLIENKYESLEDDYWKNVRPNHHYFEADEIDTLVSRLVDAKRPSVAFAHARFAFDRMSKEILAQLMQALPYTKEGDGAYQLDGYAVSTALATLSKSGALAQNELAHLEFVFIQALDHSEHGIPNLERQIAENPNEFVQLVGLMFKRSDDGEDPPELRWPEGADKNDAGGRIYRTLDHISLIPGTDESGKIDADILCEWITNVREQLQKLARVVVGEHKVGELLSKAPAGDDGIWPHPAVRIALENCGTSDIARGIELGIYNGRGVVSRGPGGDQERELAERYRGWSKALEAQHPFSARTLESVAKMYDRDAEWHDTDEAVRKRLRR